MSPPIRRKYRASVAFATGCRRINKSRRCNRKIRVPIAMWPCRVEEKMTLKEVDGKTIQEFETKIIAKDGTITRVPGTFQDYETSEEESVERPRKRDLYGFVDHPQLQQRSHRNEFAPRRLSQPTKSKANLSHQYFFVPKSYDHNPSFPCLFHGLMAFSWMQCQNLAGKRNQNGYNVLQNVKNQVVHNAFQNSRVQNVGNQNRLIVVQGIANQNSNRNGNVVAARAEGNANGIMTQLLIAQKEEAGIQLQAKEFDLMAAIVDLDEIEEFNEN
ncbi:hypothetical protein Tco_1209648 [Tanacetum coccineum]